MLAHDEARLFKHDYIGTEHILLGLLREEVGVAADVLASLDVTIEEVRAQIARIVRQGDEVPTGQMPFAPRASKVLELALQEALELDHDYIGTEHILLGLVREDGGVGARILRDFDAGPQKVRNELTRLLSGPSRREKTRGRRRVRLTHEAAPFLHADNRPAQLLVACPVCATPIETISIGQPNATFAVEAEGDRDCAVCGGRWTISYSVSWKARAE